VDLTVEGLSAKLCSTLSSPTAGIPTEEELEPFQQFFDLIRETMSGRRLFLGLPGPMEEFSEVVRGKKKTSKETPSDNEPPTIVGFGPEDMQQGDVIAAFDGDEIPYFFILRPFGGGMYHQLREAYGVSLGDAMYGKGHEPITRDVLRSVEIVLV
jgi:hypothetical protein